MPAPRALSSPRTRWENVMMNNYGTPDLALVKGEGRTVVDSDGNTYLDLIAGVAVNALGHANPAIVDAVTTQLQTIGHTSNLYITEPALELGEQLLSRLGVDGKVFFCNSGTEANETALKIARRTGRSTIIAASGGFHGRTMGALSMTGQPTKQAPFTPLVPGVRFVPYGDSAALAEAVKEDVAAVFLEPILGEAGVVVPPEGYLTDARRITAENGALLVLDEVQTGIARTGEFYAHQYENNAVPDVMTLAKGLGGGLPIGACVATGAAADLLAPGQHGATFGGNPISAAASLAVLREIDRHDLGENARRMGELLKSGIESLNDPLIAEVRGKGLLRGVLLTSPYSRSFQESARRRGFLVNTPAPNVVRIAPPLNITEQEIQRFLDAVPAIVGDVAQNGR